jgi:hypothetical protein
MTAGIGDESDFLMQGNQVPGRQGVDVLAGRFMLKWRSLWRRRTPRGPSQAAEKLIL